MLGKGKQNTGKVAVCSTCERGVDEQHPVDQI